MAEPLKFDQVNALWYGEGDIAPLPVHQTEDGENISCWELSAEEQIAVLETGRVWLRVWGQHPAVYVDGVAPFAVVEA